MQNILCPPPTLKGPPTHQDEQQCPFSSITAASRKEAISNQSDLGAGRKEDHPMAMLRLWRSPYNTLTQNIPCWDISYRTRCHQQLQALHAPPHAGQAPPSDRQQNVKLGHLFEWLQDSTSVKDINSETHQFLNKVFPWEEFTTKFPFRIPSYRCHIRSGHRPR